MAYTTDSAVFASQVAAARQVAGRHPVGRNRRAPAVVTQIAENVRTARRLGVGGVILFSYDTLTDPSHGPGYLNQVARAAFGQ
jgi:hypothetical protein